MDLEYYIPLKDGRIVTLVGRIDMYDPKQKLIIDLKTTKSLEWQKERGYIPRPEHILQLQCYYTMFSRTIPIQNLNLVYVDNAHLFAYKIKEMDKTEWIKSRVQEIEDSLSSKRIPQGEASGLCKYCRYQTTCHYDGDGLIERPLSIPKKLKFPSSIYT